MNEIRGTMAPAGKELAAERRGRISGRPAAKPSQLTRIETLREAKGARVKAALLAASAANTLFEPK